MFRWYRGNTGNFWICGGTWNRVGRGVSHVVRLLNYGTLGTLGTL
jgi:hypothetical protein